MKRVKLLKTLIKLARVKHWLKNFLIFLPLIFSGSLTNLKLFALTLIAFFLFSFVSSVVYILNDINDIENDRKHPQKKNRPLASGAISIKYAYIFLIILLLISMIIGIAISIKLNNLYVILIVLSYFILNILYSKKLKNYPIVDVVVIVIGFVLRLLLGSIVTGIEISNWLYLMVMFTGFYFDFGKRRNEFIQCKDESRKVLSKYNKEFLDKNMNVCLTLSIICYSLWCVDETTIIRIGNNLLISSVPFLMIILFIYSLDIEGESGGDPTEVLLNNKFLLMALILYCIYMLLIIYIF